MTEEFVVWGVRCGDSWCGIEGKDGPIWSFKRSGLEDEHPQLDVEPLPDHLVARIPEAAEALVRWLTIRKLRAEVEGKCLANLTAYWPGEVTRTDEICCGSVHVREPKVDCDCGCG